MSTVCTIQEIKDERLVEKQIILTSGLYISLGECFHLDAGST